MYPTIQAAIDAAAPGSEVHVAPGTYSGTGNRDIDPHGKSIRILGLGGSAGTVIDCQGSALTPHRAFMISSGDSGLVIEGFTIRSGFASDGGGIRIQDASPTVLSVRLESCSAETGGALLLDGWGTPQPGAATFTNCTFSQNVATEFGAGAAIRGQGAAATFQGCSFTTNQAAGGLGWGGATGVSFDAQVAFATCEFTGNGASRGGAVLVNQNADLTLDSCTISSNVATGESGGLSIDSSGSVVSIVNSTISGNTGTGGGGFVAAESVVTVQGTTIANNTCTIGSGGGAWLFLSAAVTITNSTISGNSAAGGGGLAIGEGTTVTCTDVTVTGNQATGAGGGVQVIGGANPVPAALTFVGGEISGNTAAGFGGGVTVSGSATSTFEGTLVLNNSGFDGGGLIADSGASLLLDRTSLIGNTATNAGGGLAASFGASAALDRCILVDNTAAGGVGGGILVSQAPTTGPTLRALRSIVRGNHAPNNQGGGIAVLHGASADLAGLLVIANSAGDGSGVLVWDQSQAAIVNSTLAGNTTPWGDREIRAVNSTVTLDNSIVRGAPPLAVDVIPPGSLTASFSDIEGGFPGPGNFDADPLFEDPLSFSYRLLAASPCRDVGSDTLVPAGLTTDLDENARILCAAVDVGAHEFTTFVGTADDLVLETLVDGAGYACPFRSIATGQILTLVLHTPAGTFIGAPPIIAGNLFAPAAPPTPPFVVPHLHLDAATVIVLVDGTAPPPFFGQVIGPAGFLVSYVVPPLLSGLRLRIQGATISALAGNGLYALSNAVEISFL